MLLPLKTQEDLDRAVQMVGCGNGVNGLLRVLLKTPKNNHVSPAAAPQPVDARRASCATANRVQATVHHRDQDAHCCKVLLKFESFVN